MTERHQQPDSRPPLAPARPRGTCGGFALTPNRLSHLFVSNARGKLGTGPGCRTLARKPGTLRWLPSALHALEPSRRTGKCGTRQRPRPCQTLHLNLQLRRWTSLRRAPTEPRGREAPGPPLTGIPTPRRRTALVRMDTPEATALPRERSARREHTRRPTAGRARCRACSRTTSPARWA